jgi:hypothetical protein
MRLQRQQLVRRRAQRIRKIIDTKRLPNPRIPQPSDSRPRHPKNTCVVFALPSSKEFDSETLIVIPPQ